MRSMPCTSKSFVTMRGYGPKGSALPSVTTVSSVSAILQSLPPARARPGRIRASAGAIAGGVCRRVESPVAAEARDALATLQAREQRIRAGGGDVLHELVVHLERGGHAAGGEALDGLERVLPVGRRLATAHTQARFEVRQHVVAAAQVAGDAGADFDDVRADRLAVEHRIEGDDRLH